MCYLSCASADSSPLFTNISKFLQIFDKVKGKTLNLNQLIIFDTIPSIRQLFRSYIRKEHFSYILISRSGSDWMFKLR